MEVHVISAGIWVNLINLLVTLTAEMMTHNFRGEVSRGHAETDLLKKAHLGPWVTPQMSRRHTELCTVALSDETMRPLVSGEPPVLGLSVPALLTSAVTVFRPFP